MHVTLVTGGAKNLGKEICLTLARNKQNIVVHYHTSEKQALDVVLECKKLGVVAFAIQGDFSTFESTAEFIEKYKKQFPSTKNLVNNVGNYLVKKPHETDVLQMADLFQTNLFAPFHLMKSLMAEISKESGSVVNIGVAGINTANAESYSTAYSMTKLSLLMLTKSFAKECASIGVSFNMVSPGLLEGSIDAPDDAGKLPMKRLGTYREVADVVSFLLNNHYITGQNIEVAGGVRL